MTREPRSSLSHRQWMDLATEEYRRIAALLDGLTPAQWAAPTDCAGWTVRDVVAHLVGGAEACARIREQMRQQRLGRANRGDGLQLDAVNRLQVDERTGVDISGLREQFADATQRALRARRRLPRPVRALRLPLPAPVGWASLGYLYDTVYTRDAWMHRIDICRATGLPLEFTADHDAPIASDAARAWQHVTGASGYVLTGPDGETIAGSNEQPDDTPRYDAVEFARALSGRGTLAGVAADAVLF